MVNKFYLFIKTIINHHNVAILSYFSFSLTQYQIFNMKQDGAKEDMEIGHMIVGEWGHLLGGTGGSCIIYYSLAWHRVKEGYT